MSLQTVRLNWQMAHLTDSVTEELRELARLRERVAGTFSSAVVG